MPRDIAEPQGHVFLVGAGPGDPELLTVKATRMLAAADTIVHDRLVSAEILALAPPNAARIDVGKRPDFHPVPQDRINAILISHARMGETVVRLKGGDPFIFGRGSEEADALRAAGIEVSVAPGITAAQGVSAATGIPLTHRGLASSVRYITGHCRANLPLDLDWAGLADPDTTLVVYMGVANAQEISSRLLAEGAAPQRPTLLVVNGTRADEARIFCTLGTMAEAAQDAPHGPALFIIGEVVTLAEGWPDLTNINSALMAATAHG